LGPAIRSSFRSLSRSVCGSPLECRTEQMSDLQPVSATSKRWQHSQTPTSCLPHP
jgi:hypothetical protein